jgi:hypothetical protein
MATNNSINADLSIEITKGGTAKASFTEYAVICGGTTSTGALQSIASVGSATQVLTSNGASSLPTFENAPTTQMEFQSLASDPVSPTDGQVWYNTTSDTFKGQANSSTVTFTVT